MQQTLYNYYTDESGNRVQDPAQLGRHVQFAQDVGEKQRLVHQAVQVHHSIWHNLLLYQQDRYWVFMVWALETFWLLFVIMANVMEFWGSCPYEMGLAPVCQYCYSSNFLLWNGVWVFLAFLSLYEYILLRSRGFQFFARTMGWVYDINKEIPENAITFFLLVNAAIVIWIIVGIMFVIDSYSCLGGGQQLYVRPRSELMFLTALISITFSPLIFLLGRCSDVTGCCVTTFPFDPEED